MTFNVTQSDSIYRITPYSSSFGNGRAMGGTNGTPTLTTGGTAYTMKWENGYIRISDSTGAYSLSDTGTLSFAATADTDDQRWMLVSTTKPVTRTAVTTGGLNVRSGAGTAYASIGVFSSGTTVTVMGEPANTKWYCVYGLTESGAYVYGFTSNTYLSFN